MQVVIGAIYCYQAHLNDCVNQMLMAFVSLSLQTAAICLFKSEFNNLLIYFGAIVGMYLAFGFLLPEAVAQFINILINFSASVSFGIDICGKMVKQRSNKFFDWSMCFPSTVSFASWVTSYYLVNELPLAFANSLGFLLSIGQMIAYFRNKGTIGDNNPLFLTVKWIPPVFSKVGFSFEAEEVHLDEKKT
eukprot:CAMPEP_0202959592 /NCGR_PEP_ID=MMETSP1396-20130829/3777_1 /ASSEMBLY_ACC=CAM_ASM_000872 /TAXON_ID= /ORGANISM="Pseudokeronopsis sp., Strain Brazil" /LENGTH=189 /DNA_ID=CAMNT_0049678241 /DNA_START=185 /DNA_END=754 /DNA_ORIENTATION=-